MYLDITIKRPCVEKRQKYKRLHQSVKKRNSENVDKPFSIRKLSKRLNKSLVVGKLSTVSESFKLLQEDI